MEPRVRWNVYLSQEQIDDLGVVSKRVGIKRAELVRQAVDAFLEQNLKRTVKKEAAHESHGTAKKHRR
jgi:metal-responsive CopG/Arc/MetJ family transcriptional regulator